MSDGRHLDPAGPPEPAGPLEPVAPGPGPDDIVGPVDPDALGAALGAVAAAVEGVTRVQPRTGLGEMVQGALGGAVGGLRSLVGHRGAAVDRTAGPSGPVVGIALSDVEVRLTVDLCVAEAATAPAVARRVAEALLAHPALAGLPPASVDLRVVGVDP
ncbi:hypothetical protein [Frigoribacterium salinisoli]